MYGLNLTRFDPIGNDTSPLNIALGSMSRNINLNPTPMSLNNNNASNISIDGNVGKITAAPVSIEQVLVAQQPGLLPPLSKSQLPTHISATVTSISNNSNTSHISNVGTHVGIPSLQQPNMEQRRRPVQRPKSQSRSPPQPLEQMQQLQQLQQLHRLRQSQQRQQQQQQKVMQSQAQAQQLKHLEQLQQLQQLQQLEQKVQQAQQAQQAQQSQQVQQVQLHQNQQFVNNLTGGPNLHQALADITNTKSNTSHGSHNSRGSHGSHNSQCSKGSGHSIKMQRQTISPPNALIQLKKENHGIIGVGGFGAVSNVSGVNSGMNVNVASGVDSSLDRLKQIVASSITNNPANVQLSGLISNTLASVKSNPVVNGCNNCQLWQQRGFNVCSSCGQRLK